MPKKEGHRPGDIILDRYVPHLSPEDREIARDRLAQWMNWKLHIYLEQVRKDRACGGSLPRGDLTDIPSLDEDMQNMD